MSETLGNMALIAWELRWWIVIVTIVVLLLVLAFGDSETSPSSPHVMGWTSDNGGSRWECSCGESGVSLTSAQDHLFFVLDIGGHHE